MTESYVALDLETTGLNPKYDKILEIGAIKIINGKEEDSFSVLVNPGRDISPTVQELTGIRPDMLKDAWELPDAMEKLLEFCEDYILLGHNIQFDFSFVKKNAVNLGMQFERAGIDTLKIARKCLPQLEKRSLTSLCTYYGIHNEQAHRAIHDARAAHLVYGRLKEQFFTKYGDVFAAQDLKYQAKKEGPITPAQKSYLKDLVSYHKIELDVSIDSMTKNEASRVIDGIILQYGKIARASFR